MLQLFLMLLRTWSSSPFRNAECAFGFRIASSVPFSCCSHSKWSIVSILELAERWSTLNSSTTCDPIIRTPLFSFWSERIPWIRSLTTMLWIITHAWSISVIFLCVHSWNYCREILNLPSSMPKSLSTSLRLLYCAYIIAIYFAFVALWIGLTKIDQLG